MSLGPGSARVQPAGDEEARAGPCERQAPTRDDVSTAPSPATPRRTGLHYGRRSGIDPSVAHRTTLRNQAEAPTPQGRRPASVTPDSAPPGRERRHERSGCLARARHRRRERDRLRHVWTALTAGRRSGRSGSGAVAALELLPAPAPARVVAADVPALVDHGLRGAHRRGRWRGKRGRGAPARRGDRVGARCSCSCS